MEKELTSAITWNILEDLSDGVVIVDEAGTVIYCNAAVSSLLGLELKHQVNVLNSVRQVLASFDAWSDLLDSPAETVLSLANGRALQAQSQTINTVDGEFTQLILKPNVDTRPESTSFDYIAALIELNNEPDPHKQLQLLANELQATGWQRVVITLRDEAFNPVRLITAGFTKKETRDLGKKLLPREAWLALFNEKDWQQYRQGGCYFVPRESAWSKKYLNGGQTKTGNTSKNQWQPFDIICAPLTDRKQQRIGLISLDEPRNGRRPSKQTLQIIELYAQYAAAIIDNARLVQEALDRSQEFELLLTASNALSSSLETDSVLSLLGKHMLEAIKAEGYTIFEWRSGEEQLVILKDASADHSQPTQKRGTVINISESKNLKQALVEGKPIISRQENKTGTPLPPPVWLTADDEPSNWAIFPLILSDATYAIILLINRGQQEISERESRLLSTLANQAGTALETALIFEDTYERERFYGALGNVSLALNYTLERDRVVNLICSESLRIFNVDGAYLWQVEGDFLVSSAAKGFSEHLFKEQKVPLSDEQSFVSLIAMEGLGSYLNDVHNQSVQVSLPKSGKIQAVLGVPLEAEGNLIGILILADTQNANRFSDKDVNQATTFGVQVAGAVQNANLFEELRQLNEELDSRVANRARELHEESNRVKILLRITTELSASLDQDRVLTQALDLVNEVVNASSGVILLVNQESGEFDFRASMDNKRPYSHKAAPSGLKRNEGLAGWMLENRSAVIVYDTKEDPRWLELPTSSQHRSVLGVPLISNEEVIGVLMLFHTEVNAFTNQQLDLVEAAAIQVANAINNASLYNLIFDQAEQLGSMLRGEIIQKANLQSILESIADGVIVANNKNEIEITNLSATSILEIPRQQLVGKSINELLGVYGQFGDVWLDTINHWADNSDQLEQGTYLDDQLVIEEKYVSIHLSPVLSDGTFFGTVSIFRDITKEVEVDRLKSEFVSTVSHELRTPMTSIKGYADLMLMGAAGQLTDPQIKYLQVIKSNADRLHDLVNDLLNISRIETGKTTLDLRPLDISQIVEQIVSHIEGRIQHEEKEMTIHTSLAPGLPLVNADRVRVIQILTNLADNAFNYTPENGNIQIDVLATDNFVFISVSDDGIGIADDNIDKIFDRFYRAEDADVQKVAGTGLGLAIVQSFIEMHGGHLEVESKIGKGSTFTFNLPIVVEDEDSDPT